MKKASTNLLVGSEIRFIDDMDRWTPREDLLGLAGKVGTIVSLGGDGTVYNVLVDGKLYTGLWNQIFTVTTLPTAKEDRIIKLLESIDGSLDRIWETVFKMSIQ